MATYQNTGELVLNFRLGGQAYQVAPKALIELPDCFGHIVHNRHWSLLEVTPSPEESYYQARIHDEPIYPDSPAGLYVIQEQIDLSDYGPNLRCLIKFPGHPDLPKAPAKPKAKAKAKAKAKPKL